MSILSHEDRAFIVGVIDAYETEVERAASGGRVDGHPASWAARRIHARLLKATMRAQYDAFGTEERRLREQLWPCADHDVVDCPRCSPVTAPVEQAHDA